MNRGSIPPGLSTPAESWRRMVGGEIAAMMRPIPFDGSQACLDSMAFTDREEWEPDAAEPLRRICESCGWLTRCRDWALAHERYTYMGGMSPDERRRVRKALRLQVVDRYSAELYGLASYMPESLSRVK